MNLQRQLTAFLVGAGTGIYLYKLWLDYCNAHLCRTPPLKSCIDKPAVNLLDAMTRLHEVNTVESCVPDVSVVSPAVSPTVSSPPLDEIPPEMTLSRILSMTQPPANAGHNEVQPSANVD